MSICIYCQTFEAKYHKLKIIDILWLSANSMARGACNGPHIPWAFMLRWLLPFTCFGRHILDALLLAFTAIYLLLFQLEQRKQMHKQ